MAEQSKDTAAVVLSVEGLEKRFPVKKRPPITALAGISLNARQGQITGLVGADGAGKTSLIRCAVGLLVPSAGRVTVLGLDSVADTLAIQSRVGYMPQKFGLYQDLSVAENMDLYADLQGVPDAERDERYRRLLAMTGLASFTRRRAGALSGGMKQKLGLACALIKSPQVLILDEPTVGVDPVSRRELWKIIDELVYKESIGVFVSTAYLDEAQRCDHVVVLHEGRVLAEGPPRLFMSRMAGRVCRVSPPPAASARRLYARLAGQEHIVDATIRSGRVRVVTDVSDSGASTLVSAALVGEDVGGIEEVAPNFEDAFMAIIPRSEHHYLPEGSPFAVPTAANGDRDVVVQTRDLQKFFGEFEAVKRLSFCVYRGEIFGLLGPNGAGKSTTFRMLCGLLPASSGEISVAGHDLSRSRASARARLGYMAQQFSLYGQLSTTENLRFFGKAYGLDKERLQRRLEWAFAEFDLGPWRDKPAGVLPGGYKQRLSMAAALLHEPEIIFLDEPTSGVDPFARREFWLRINGFAEQGVTVVVTTHFMEEAEYCDRMLIMSQGDTLAMGTPREIRNLARSSQNPRPTMDDAFIALAEGQVTSHVHDQTALDKG